MDRMGWDGVGKIEAIGGQEMQVKKKRKKHRKFQRLFEDIAMKGKLNSTT